MNAYSVLLRRTSVALALTTLLAACGGGDDPSVEAQGPPTALEASPGRAEAAQDDWETPVVRKPRIEPRNAASSANAVEVGQAASQADPVSAAAQTDAEVNARTATALAFTPMASSSAQSAGARNVLLIIADDVGVDKISRYVRYYNSETSSSADDMFDETEVTRIAAPKSPNIDNLAKAGVTFLNAWSSPTCSPTRAGVYTGQYAAHNLVYSPEDGELSDSTTTIAERLRTETVDYMSGLFGKWHLGGKLENTVTKEETNLPTNELHGWRVFKGSTAGALLEYDDWYKTESKYGSLAPATVTRETGDTKYAAFVNVDDAYGWIAEITSAKSTQRWMATVAFNAAHWVDNVADKERSLKGQMPPVDGHCKTTDDAGENDDEDAVFIYTVECMDEEIGRLLSSLGGKLGNTTIIFMGDNGTDKDRTTHVRFQNGRAKGTVYEGGVNVPLIIADGRTYLFRKTGSGVGRVVRANRTSKALVQTVDLFATVEAIAGAPATSADSFSLIPLLEGTVSKVRDFAVTEGEVVVGNVTKKEMAVRDSRYKLLRRYDSAADKMVCELYEVGGSDRWEKTELLFDGGTSDWERNARDNLLKAFTNKTGLTYSCS